MTILTMPAILAAQLDWQLHTNTQAFTSPISNVTQTAEMVSPRWAATLTFKDRNPSQIRAWLAFEIQLRGPAGRCYLSPSVAFPRLGAGGGPPLVNGASQTGTSLLIKGATPNVTGWLKAGDPFSFDSTGRELKFATADVNTDASGNATIPFEPPIRFSPANNAAVEITAPSAIMRLVDDSQIKWTITPPVLGAGTRQFVESFPS